jgi:hypothetical protein
MTRRQRSLGVLLVVSGFVIACLVLPDAATAAVRVPRDRHGNYVSTTPWENVSEFVFEAGAVIPEGDLGDDYFGTTHGLGAGTGYDLGVRYRYYLTERTAVSPAFHYANFGNFKGSLDDNGTERGFEINTELYRFGLGLQQFFGDPDAQVQGFVSASLVFFHNRYRDQLSGFQDYRSSSNNLGLEAGAGLRLGPIELGGYYDLDRTKNKDLAEAGTSTSFDWDHVAVRAGVSMGRF